VLAARLEPVGIGIDVIAGAEPPVRDRTVVALEIVLAADLPVRGQLVLVTGAEDEVVDRKQVGQRAKCFGERRRVLGGVDEEERAPALESERNER